MLEVGGRRNVVGQGEGAVILAGRQRSLSRAPSSLFWGGRTPDRSLIPTTGGNRTERWGSGRSGGAGPAAGVFLRWGYCLGKSDLLFLRYHCPLLCRAMNTGKRRQGGQCLQAGTPGGRGGGRPFVQLKGLPDAPRVSCQVE